jgi:L-threonylcarbamoyladenylate synthase
MNLEGQFGVTEEQVREAAALLRKGQLVAFPTETVYGLGANALDAAAVQRIFDAKGRPRTSPLIVHVSSIQMARELAAEWPPNAQELAERFWPGPLTLVVTKKSIIPDTVTAGLPTVGLRMPEHPVALALLREAGIPVAAPSANRFTQLSPTTAEHVRRGLGERVSYILDGGPCPVGIESTVLSVVEQPAILLRPGGVSRSEIQEVIGTVVSQAHAEVSGAHPSPGMHPQHYSPRTPLILVNGGIIPAHGSGVYLQLRRTPSHAATVVLMPADAREYASRLYATLHKIDQQAYDWIAVDAPEESPEWEGVLDRLKRAAAGWPK